MKIFENKHYTKTIFIAITIISLLILFTITNIASEITQEKTEKLKNYKITGLIITDQEYLGVENPYEKNKTTNKIESDKEQTQLYSEKSYFIYYMILMILGIGIFIVVAGIILPRIKKYT